MVPYYYNIYPDCKLAEEVGAPMGALQWLCHKITASKEYEELIEAAEEAGLKRLLNKLEKCILAIDKIETKVIRALIQYESDRNLTNFNVKVLLFRIQIVLGEPVFVEFFIVIKAIYEKLGVRING